MRLFTFAVFLLFTIAIFGQTKVSNSKSNILTGAEQTDKYIPYLKNKRVAVLANPTTIIGKKHLIDSLVLRKINIVKVFGPEHGFRGNASAGIKVADEKDPTTGIKIISLYGAKRKPSKQDLPNWHRLL